MDKKESLKHKILWIVICMLCGVGIILMLILAYSNGINLESNNGGKLTYSNDIEKVVSKVGFNVDIPDKLLDMQTQELEVRDVLGQILEVNGGSFVFKAAMFVDKNADPLGLYEKSDIDTEYSILDAAEGEINTIRIRYGYPEYSNCTLVNWYTSTTAYGAMINKKLAYNEIVDMLGLNEDTMTEGNSTSENNVSEETDDITEYKEYRFFDGVTMEFPVFTSEFKFIEIGGISLGYIADKLCFAVQINAENDENNSLSGENEVSDGKLITIKYLSENPFDLYSDGYNDYNRFIETINDILNSIKYQ